MKSKADSGLGFEFHSSRRWQAGRDFAVSLSVFVVILTMILSDDIAMSQMWREKPAWLFAAAIFLIFSLSLGSQFIRIWRTRWVLEFTDQEMIDRRYRKARVIPFKKIEIFSPKPDSLFEADLQLQDFVTISCRLYGADEDFVFFERIRPVARETQALIVDRLTSKIENFAQLFDDMGDDDVEIVGDFDQTNS